MKSLCIVQLKAILADEELSLNINAYEYIYIKS